MHRQEQNPLQLELLHALDKYARAKGLPLVADNIEEPFLAHVKDQINRHRNHKARLYGLRTESMFAHVAAAMGECFLITEEDSGNLFTENEYIRRPDFRIVTKKREQFLVEVKNFHAKQPFSSYQFDEQYIQTLKDYASICSIPLKFAIYWSRWNLWTLTSLECLKRVKGGFELAMKAAVMENEMYLLGDCMYGCTPPLSLRLFADTDYPRTCDDDGKCELRIANAGIYVENKEVIDDYEKKLAWYFLLHGDWDSIHQAEVNNGQLDYVEFYAEPKEDLCTTRTSRFGL
ncbi:MAG: hypothetical protein QM811_06545 [Pirellulales bacterium]